MTQASLSCFPGRTVLCSALFCSALHIIVQCSSSKSLLGLLPRPTTVSGSLCRHSPQKATVAISPALTDSTGRSQRRRVSSVSHHHQHAVGAAGRRQPSPAARERGLDTATTSVVHSSSDAQEMSLSRSPSPQRGGGWASPGLNHNFNSQSRSSTPVASYSVNGSHSVTWASAQAKSAQVKGYPAYQERSLGFFGKHMRKISSSLPFFHQAPKDDRFTEKEKLGRGRWQPPSGGSRWSNVTGRIGRLVWRMRLRLAIVLGLILTVVCFYATRTYPFSCLTLGCRLPRNV